MPLPPGPTIDLSQVPYTRRGSFFAVSELNDGPHGGAGLYLRTVHGDAKQRAVFRLEILHEGLEAPVDYHASPAGLTLKSGDHGVVDLSMSGDTVVIAGTGVSLVLHPVLDSPYDLVLEVARGQWQYNDFGANVNFMVTATQGELSGEPGWDGLRSEGATLLIQPGRDDLGEGGSFDLVIEEFRSSYLPSACSRDVVQLRAEAEQEFSHWPQLQSPVPEKYEPARQLAAYVNWSSTVGPYRQLARPTMLMSKNWMTKAWSWDHCFNAMALVQEPRQATDQFLTLFDHQDAFGALPDFIDDATISFNFAKPPVHGWAWQWMADRMEVDESVRLRVHGHLSRLTEWWLKHRVTGAGLPHYRHGNDSGWDNSTAFRRVVPIESPDLCAFLVLQMEALAELSSQLNRPDERDRWQARADELLSRMVAELWVDDRFVARSSVTREVIPSSSLLMLVPLILGERLPAAIVNALTEDLITGGFLTEYGLATESVESEFYLPDGYWRGPIWAPSTLIIHEGLVACGRSQFATEVARRFCDTAAEAGMAENFDALSGSGLRDRAYTWTASVFIILAERLAQSENTLEEAP